jgi:hypothetical protein
MTVAFDNLHHLVLRVKHERITKGIIDIEYTVKSAM